MTPTVVAERATVASGVFVTKWALSVLLVAIQIVSPTFDPAFFALIALSLWAINAEPLVSVGNAAVVYFFIVLGIGPLVIADVDTQRVHTFGAALAGVFLLASVVVRLVGTRLHARAEGQHHVSPQAYNRGVQLLYIAVLIQSGLLAIDVARVGPRGYLRGATLRETLDTYAGGGLGSLDILNYGIRLFVFAAVATHVAATPRWGRIRWTLLTVLLLVLPFLRLSRGLVLVGALTLLFIAAWSNQGRLRRKGRPAVAVLMVVGISSLTAVGVGVGLLRESAIGGQGRESSAVGVLVGELSPVVVVNASLTPGVKRYGSEALVEPALTRFVPRRLYPEKPPSATTRFMSTYAPGALRHGYSLAPTGVGALVLAFGPWMTLSLVFFLFVLCRAKLDRPPVSPAVAGLRVVLVSNLYNILRNDLVNSVNDLLLSVVAFLCLRAVVVARGRTPV